MKVKLWEVYAKHKNPSYFGDLNSITVRARNIHEALTKAEKNSELKDYLIYKIKLVASED